MKILLKIFLGTFVLLFVIGLLSGFSDKKNKIRAVALHNLSVVNHSSSSYLAFICNKQIKYLYDIESNSLNRNPSRLADVSLLPVILSLRAHKELIITTLGGSSGAITISKLWGRETKVKKTVALVLGFTSGYLAGYWVATLMEIQCDSSSMENLLDQPDVWKQIEHDYINYKLYELGIEDNKWNNTIVISDTSSRQVENVGAYANFSMSPLRRCGTPLSARITTLVEELGKGKDPGSADIQIISEYESIISKLKNDGGYRKLSACLTALISDGSTLKNNDNACNSLGFSESFIEQGRKRTDSSSKGSAKIFRNIIMRKPLWFEENPEFLYACNKVFQESIGRVP